MQVLPRCGHCVHEDAPDKVTSGSSGCERICFLFGFVAVPKYAFLSQTAPLVAKVALAGLEIH